MGDQHAKCSGIVRRGSRPAPSVVRTCAGLREWATSEHVGASIDLRVLSFVTSWLAQCSLERRHAKCACARGERKRLCATTGRHADVFGRFLLPVGTAKDPWFPGVSYAACAGARVNAADSRRCTFALEKRRFAFAD